MRRRRREGERPDSVSAGSNARLGYAAAPLGSVRSPPKRPPRDARGQDAARSSRPAARLINPPHRLAIGCSRIADVKLADLAQKADEDATVVLVVIDHQDVWSVSGSRVVSYGGPKIGNVLAVMSRAKLLMIAFR